MEAEKYNSQGLGFAELPQLGNKTGEQVFLKKDGERAEVSTFIISRQ